MPALQLLTAPPPSERPAGVPSTGVGAQTGAPTPMVAVIAQVARGNRAIRLCRQAIEQGQRGAMINLAALLLDESAGECGTVAVSAARRKQYANK